MIIPAILRDFGSDEVAIRKLFTAQAGDELYAKRKAWEDRIRSRLSEGTTFNLANYQFYAAADLAWDSNMITKELVPLSLYAQNKITFKSAASALKDISAETAAQFVEYDDKGNPTAIKIPEFHKVVVNLVRSFVTRRTAALSTKYVNQFPFFKYEPLSTSFVAKLRGDALSQRIEMISNSYDYRHLLTQVIRYMLLYTHAYEFVANAWDCEKQLRFAVRESGMEGKPKVEAKIVKEGLLYNLPHPTRVFTDPSFPPSTLNTDTGCTYAGYWNVLKYGDVAHNPVYFNRDRIEFSNSFAELLKGGRPYFELYYSTAPVNFPDLAKMADVPGANDRQKNVGLYNDDVADDSLIVTEYFEKVVPKAVGIGEYPYPVWVRLLVAGDNTVIFGEVLSGTPCNVYSYNAHDGKLLNNSFAHDAIPWTDQLSNQLTCLLHSQKASLIKIISMDVGMINDAELVAKIRKIVKEGAIYSGPMLLEYRSDTYAEVGANPREAVSVTETDALNDVGAYFRSIVQLLGLAERILGISSNENAQSEPREISATESANIATVTSTSLSFMGQGIDEGIDAKKRQLYEAFMAYGASRIVVPAAGRYLPDTVKKAGFEVLDEDSDVASNLANRRLTIIGTKEQLEYDYNFSSRDGSERPSNAKAAEILVNMLTQFVQFPGVLQALGKTRLYELLNHIVHLSGAGVDFKFEMSEGEEDAVPTGDAAADGKAQIEQALSLVIGKIQELEARMNGVQPPAPEQAPQPPTI